MCCISTIITNKTVLNSLISNLHLISYITYDIANRITFVSLYRHNNLILLSILLRIRRYVYIIQTSPIFAYDYWLNNNTVDLNNRLLWFYHLIFSMRRVTYDRFGIILSSFERAKKSRAQTVFLYLYMDLYGPLAIIYMLA